MHTNERQCPGLDSDLGPGVGVHSRPRSWGLPKSVIISCFSANSGGEETRLFPKRAAFPARKAEFLSSIIFLSCTQSDKLILSTGQKTVCHSGRCWEKALFPAPTRNPPLPTTSDQVAAQPRNRGDSDQNSHFLSCTQPDYNKFRGTL